MLFYTNVCIVFYVYFILSYYKFQVTEPLNISKVYLLCMITKRYYLSFVFNYFEEISIGMRYSAFNIKGNGFGIKLPQIVLNKPPKYFT